MSLVINPYSVAAAVLAASISYEGVKTADAGGASVTRTFNATPVGAAASGRRIILLVHWYGGAARSISSALIGGVSATIHAQVTNPTTYGGAYTMGVGIISAAVDAGTTLNVSVTFSGTMGTSVMIAAYNCVGVNSGAAIDTATAVAAHNPVALNVDVQNGGVLVAGYARYNDNGGSVSGAAEDYDLTFSGVRGFGGSLAVTANEVDRAVTFSTDSATPLYGAAVAVSLR